LRLDCILARLPHFDVDRDRWRRGRSRGFDRVRAWRETAELKESARIRLRLERLQARLGRGLARFDERSRSERHCDVLRRHIDRTGERSAWPRNELTDFDIARRVEIPEIPRRRSVDGKLQIAHTARNQTEKPTICADAALLLRARRVE